MLLLFVVCFWAANFEVIHSAPQVNPCVALKLPLCRIKSDFAQEHGIQTERPKPAAAVRPPLRPSLNRQESTSSITREGKYSDPNIDSLNVIDIGHDVL